MNFSIMDAINSRIADDLYNQGWSVIDNYLEHSLAAILRQRLDTLDAAEALTRAGIGRDDHNQVLTSIRRDFTYWLDYKNDTDMLYLSLMENLRLALNKALFLGLFEYEAHYALYPEGGFYKKHLDALKGDKNRLVSTVCYLNDLNWQDENGGKLILYDREDDTKIIHIVKPLRGTLVAFLSEDIPHEVSPTKGSRYSIAGWFRCNTSTKEKTDPLK